MGLVGLIEGVQILIKRLLVEIWCGNGVGPINRCWCAFESCCVSGSMPAGNVNIVGCIICQEHLTEVVSFGVRSKFLPLNLKS